jgi:hypothetical protein
LTEFYVDLKRHWCQNSQEISKHPAGNSKMTKRAISTGGYPIEVSTPTDPVTIPAATTSAIGGVKMAAQADSTATDVAGLLADFNALLAKARTAGLM